MANTPLGFPFGFYVADNSPIDGKYGIIAGGAWRPYVSNAEALTSLPIGVRYIGLTVNIANVEYWWKVGTADADLIVKSSGASVSLGTQGQVPVVNPTSNDFSYSNNFTWDDANKRLTIGSGNANAQGIHNYVLAPNCQIIGSWNFATGEQQIIRFGSPDAYGGINNNSFLGGYKNLMEKTGFGYGIYNTVFLGGEGNLISGPVITGAAIYGIRNKITGVSSGSLAGGIWTEVSGFNAWAHGDQTTNSGSDFNFPAPVQNVLAAGRHAFNYSANSPSQTVGHGALSNYSAILAGTDHNIPVNSPRTVVLGGNAIKVPDNRPDEVFVPALAIWNAPEVDGGTLNALVYDPSDKKVKQRAIGSGGGVAFDTSAKIPFVNSGGNNFAYSSHKFEWNDTYKRLVAGNNINISSTPFTGNTIVVGEGINISGDHSWSAYFGDVFTTSAIFNNGLMAGSGHTVSGGFSGSEAILGDGNTVDGSGNSIYGLIAGRANHYSRTSGLSSANTMLGMSNIIEGDSIDGSLVAGINSKVTADASFSFGYLINGTEKVLSAGIHAINMSANSSAQTSGHGALSNYSAILGGQDHNIPSDSPGSVILGGVAIKARAADVNQIYVPNLNIASAPDNDNALTQILVRDDSTGKIKYRDAASLNGLTANPGWTILNGGSLKGGWNTSTVTLTQLAETMKALIDHLASIGIIQYQP